MIYLSVYNKDGDKIEDLKIDESTFGGFVRYPLLKQAIVMYHANKRVGTAVTRGRGMVSGSTAKLFRQKGTGNARVGNRRTGKRVGGGMTFAKVARDFSKRMPKKQRRLATDSAVLEKLLNDSVFVIDELVFEKAKTKDFVNILGKLKIDRSCLVTINSRDENLYKSARNVPKVDVITINELNAGDVCNHSKMLFTKEAFISLLNKDKLQESN
jgi:large subunit ribosomal protein L4